MKFRQAGVCARGDREVRVPLVEIEEMWWACGDQDPRDYDLVWVLLDDALVEERVELRRVVS